MASAIALLGLTILEWPLLFFSETDFIYNYLHIVQKWTKNQCGKVKKFTISVSETSNPAIMRRSLNANLFSGEPHQLTKFA